MASIFEKPGWKGTQVLRARSLADARRAMRDGYCDGAFDALEAAAVHEGRYEAGKDSFVRGARSNEALWRAHKQIRAQFLKRCVRG